MRQAQHASQRHDQNRPPTRAHGRTSQDTLGAWCENGALRERRKRRSAGGERGALARLDAWYEAQAAAVCEVLSHEQAPLLLDVGCGDGALLRRLLEAGGSTEGIGVDASAARIAAARDLDNLIGGKRLHFVEADWEADAIPELDRVMASRRADVISCVSTFHYFRNPEVAAQRFRERLVSGGRLVVVERAMDGSLLTRLWDLVHRRFLADGVRYYSTSQVAAVFSRAGFVDVRPERHIRRLFWNGKLFTSLVIMVARTP